MNEEVEGPMIKDFVTGREILDIGAEANRQIVERVLVEEKGYSREDIVVNHPVSFQVQGLEYASRLDLLVNSFGRPFMAVKCAAGSIGSREREILAGARIGPREPAILAVVSDGSDWTVLWTSSGKVFGRGLEAIPHAEDAPDFFVKYSLWARSEEAVRKERLIFRSYDMDNVNIVR